MATTIMDKNVTTVISKQEREQLTKEIINLLNEYDYTPTETGVGKILDVWINQKGWLIELMKKHPDYVEGKYMITFDMDYNRSIDRRCVESFLEIFSSFVDSLPKPYKVRGFTYVEACYLSSRLASLKNAFFNLAVEYHCLGKADSSPIISINGKTEEDYNQEYQKFSLIKNKFDNLKHDDNFVFYVVGAEKQCFAKEEITPIINIKRFIAELSSNPDQFVSEKLATIANEISDKVQAKEGQKTSRLVNKICKLFGFDKIKYYNQNFAAFADAINPIKVKRHTVISCNPVDYFTMSFGNSWSGYHTIDKHHKRNKGSSENYDGTCSSGTLSYMLDNSSVVFYTVDKNYNGTDYELQDKINRCMFHLGEDKLIQGRVYPQSNDEGENSMCKMIREIAQKVFADCLDVPNLWSNYKGTDECKKVTESRGYHYRDYLEYESCNVSYLGRGEDNTVKILIGHKGICPCCGKEHDEMDTIECYDCWISHEYFLVKHN